MLLKTKSIGTNSDRALLLDFQAALETKPEKAIKLEKDALAQIETITAVNARLVSNLHANLEGLYRMNSHPDLPQAKIHFKRAFKIYEKIWADEPEMIKAKYQEIQELYPQVGFFLG